MGDKWKEYYTDTQLRELQSIELELLNVFTAVCRSLKIEYFLYGGSLLGSVKYGGFVPWDDDIDIALPRKHYERFLKEAPLILPDTYFIQSPYNCKETPYPYTKFRKRGTKYVEYSNRNLSIETGIYMDIYPVDRIPDGERERKKQFRKVKKWIFIYVCRQSRLYDKEEKTIKGYIKNIARFIACHVLKIFTQEYCISKIDHYMTMYNDVICRRYAAMNSPNYDNIYNSIYPLKKGVFNGFEVWLPNDYLVSAE